MIPGQDGNSFRRRELSAYLDHCDGKTLGDLDASGVFGRVVGMDRVTGVAGDVVEQSILALERNPRQEPDIEIDGERYEVKTTGLRESKKTGELEAKEPMSITAVSPETIVAEKYPASHFWEKISHMVIFWYHYASKETVPPAGYAAFVLLGHDFHEYKDFTEEERLTLKSDWERVRNFIIHLNGTCDDPESEYPRISHDLRQELMLLDTAPKWPNRPRFRFKRFFVTALWRRRDGRKQARLESLPQQYTSVRDIDDKCAEILAGFKGWTVGALCRRFGVDCGRRANKSVGEQVVVRMFGGTKKKMADIELFAKIGMVAKTIVLTKKGGRTEDVKFCNIDFGEFLSGDVGFEDSSVCDYFMQRKFLFVVFEEPDAAAPLSENTLASFSLVAFDGDFIENELRPVWERIRDTVWRGELRETPVLDRFGRPIVNKNGTIRTTINLPKSSEGVVFVRGTGADSADKTLVVNGVRMYRQQIWIKGSYLAGLTWRR